MKQIIADYLWRKSWIIAPILVMDIFVVRPFGTTGRDVGGAYFAPLLLGPFLFSSDMQNGLTRALMALPVTARQIGRAWWLSTVGAPALLLAAAACVAAILPLGNGQFGFPVLNCLLQVLLLGSLFCLLSLMPASYQSSWPEKIRGGFVGALWGLSFFGGIFLFEDFSWSSPLQAEALVATGTVLTVVGWFRAEGMVLQRGAVRPGVQVTTSKSAQYKAPAGFGGLPYLLRNLLCQLGWYGLLFVGLMILAPVLINIMEGQSLEHLRDSFHMDESMFGFYSLLFMYFVAVPPMVAHLRFLRTLPISTSVLAATLVLFPAGSILVFGVVCAAIGGGHLILGTYLFFVIVVTVLVPLFVWQGLSKGMYFLALGFVIVSGWSKYWFDSTISPIVAVSVLVFAIALGWEITRRVLRSSSRTYRVRPAMVNSWGGMRWS